MQFGTFQLANCEGAILAHSLRLQNLSIKKGTVLTKSDIDAVRVLGVTELIVAILGRDEVTEDEAAREIANALSVSGIELSEAGTGRVNFHASFNGMFAVSKEVVDQINAIDSGITFATLTDHEPILKGRLVATIKIIPYGISSKSIDAVKAATQNIDAMSVKPYKVMKIGVISTILPGLKDKTIAKTIDVLERRLASSGSKIIAHTMARHNAAAVEVEIGKLKSKCDLLIIFGASAISDIEDVIPSGLRQSGGEILRLGMPVDPGNLLMMGELNDLPVLGAPGCARSPAQNGFDFVLNRILCGMEVTSADIAGMGVGGLLMEIGSRPQPRKPSLNNSQEIAAVVLAGGQSRRMGSVNKLTAPVNGKAMVKYPVEAALTAGLTNIRVVTGHEAQNIHNALENVPVTFINNPNYADGLSTSLIAGISSLDETVSHALILLGDMPEITGAMIAQLLKVSNQASQNTIVIATNLGKRGNPVLWPRVYFEQLSEISGDTGARHIIGENMENVVEVDLGEAAALDLDTPAALSSFLTTGKI